MFNKAIMAVEDFNMLVHGDAVIAAVSGGADSMAMLHFLQRLSVGYDLKITVAHVNHGLRAREAERDECFVRDFCRVNNLEFKLLRADVAALAAQSGESTEECGRRVRYDFFKSLAQNARIATAHTAADNAETMLFNLARGSALKGLCGIPPVRENIIRPLIYCTREDVEQYCAQNGIAYVTDSSNLSLDYSRNKIRHAAVPVLRQINPAFELNALRFARSAQLDEDYLESETQRLLERSALPSGYSAQALMQAHAALRGRAVLSLLRENCPSAAGSKTLSLILDILPGTGKVQLAPDFFALCSGGTLSFQKAPREIPQWDMALPENLEFGVGVRLGRASVKCVNKKVFLDTQKIHKDILDYCIDCDKMKGKARIGSRAAGDTITLFKRGCTKSLKKLFNESGIPAHQRGGVAVLRDEEGVVWVEGFGADSRCRVTGETKRFLIIDCGGSIDEG